MGIDTEKYPEINTYARITLENGEELKAIFTYFDNMPVWKIINSEDLRLNGTCIDFYYPVKWASVNEPEVNHE